MYYELKRYKVHMLTCMYVVLLFFIYQYKNRVDEIINRKRCNCMYICMFVCLYIHGCTQNVNLGRSSQWSGLLFVWSGRRRSGVVPIWYG